MTRRTGRGRRFSPRRRLARRRLGGSLSVARASLRHQASLIALAITSLLLVLVAPLDSGDARGAEALAQTSAETPAPPDRSPGKGADIEPLGQAAAEEATRTFETLREGFEANLPKTVVVLCLLFGAWLLVRILRPLLRRTLGRWERGNAFAALLGIMIWVLAGGISLSVIVGDIRALVGSVGLIGLALSWALQTPIESFTGWLLNSFQGYYRVGDRIAVGEVFGDVYKIDFLTTTVWEIGSPARGGFVHAEQPTGRLITFPNNEVLAGTVVNLTRDFPFVWDELAVPLANESDMGYALRVLNDVARDLLGPLMIDPARRYAKILSGAGLELSVAEEPQAFVAMGESWTDVVIRYLVHARERRKWKSELTVRVLDELARAEHGGRMIPVYPRQQIQFIGPEGEPVPFPAGAGPAGKD